MIILAYDIPSTQSYKSKSSRPQAIDQVLACRISYAALKGGTHYVWITLIENINYERFAVALPTLTIPALASRASYCDNGCVI